MTLCKLAATIDSNPPPGPTQLFVDTFYITDSLADTPFYLTVF